MEKQSNQIMKTLYESILDDEDVLINRVKDHNPFELMYLLYKQYKSWKKVPKKRINNIINSLPSLPKSNHQFYYGLAPDDSLRIYVDGITAFTVTFPMFGFRIAVLPTSMQKEVKYIWGSKDDRDKYFKDIFKKYDMSYSEDTSNDIFFIR